MDSPADLSSTGTPLRLVTEVLPTPLLAEPTAGSIGWGVGLVDHELSVLAGLEPAADAGSAAAVGWPGPVGEVLGHTAGTLTPGSDLSLLEAPGALAVDALAPVGALELVAAGATGGDLVVGLTPADAVMVAADAAAATSRNTRRAYAGDWVLFQAWCARRGLEALPAGPDTVAANLSESSRVLRPNGQPAYAPATLTRWVSAINMTHANAGHPKPGEAGPIRAAMAGIRRQRGTRQRRVRPLLLSDMQTVLGAMDVETWPAGLAATRDAALLLTGFAGAFRRSELAALTIGNLIPSSTDGIHVVVERSKTDQEGAGAIKALPYGKHPATCPPCAIWRWVQLLDLVDSGAPRAVVMRWVFTHTDRTKHTCMDAAHPAEANHSGVGVGDTRRPQAHPAEVDRHGDTRPLFRSIPRTGTGIQQVPLSGHAVNEIVKRRVAAVGLNPDRFGGHSMRAGFVTEAFRSGADTHAIRRQTGHQSDAVLETYYREHAPLVGNAVTGLGL